MFVDVLNVIIVLIPDQTCVLNFQGRQRLHVYYPPVAPGSALADLRMITSARLLVKVEKKAVAKPKSPTSAASVDVALDESVQDQGPQLEPPVMQCPIG